MRFAHLVQFVDQHYPLFFHMTVMEQLTHPLIYAFKKEEVVAIETATDLLHQMGLYADRNKYPSELSGGQRQRIAILQKILLKPSYLFLDEPTSGLDRNNKFLLLRLLQSYFDSGMKIILSSHDFETINFFDNKKIFDL
jgi:ABC-type polar amino acid transport system ATPase subunit